MGKSSVNLKDEIPSEVLAAFGIHAVCAITRLGGTRNANFCVRAPAKSLFLRRRHPNYCDPAWIRFDHDAVAFLHQNDAPVLTPVSVDHGDTWFPHAGQIWEAYPWMEGNTYPETPEALESVAGSLALFHRAGREFSGRFRPGGYARGEMTPGRLLGIARALVPSCGEIAGFYASQVETAAKRLDERTYHALPHTLVHGDVQPANMIFAESDVLCFVDYDWLGRQPVIYDIAEALILFCARRERPIDGANIWSLSMPFEFDRESARTFLQTYQEGNDLPTNVLPHLMEQVRLTWAHIRLSGARKVKVEERETFLSRDLERPFAWIDESREDVELLDT